MTTQTQEKQIRRSAIRWPGLAAFIVICAVLVLFSWLLLDTILRWTMQTTLGTLNGAEVNIESVEHRWSPLGLKAKGVQFTDPAEPDFNRLVVGEIDGHLNVEQLLLGRVHFETVVSTGIRVHQPRESTGDVYEIPDKSEISKWAKQGLDSLDIKLPSVDDIVGRVDLKTPTAIAAAKANYQEHKAKVDAARESIPTEDELQAYQDQLKVLSETEVKTPEDLSKLQKQLADLKARFKADRERLANFKATVTAAAEQVKSDLAAVQDAPGQDMERVQELMQLNSEGLTEITAVLFGEQMRQWSQYVLLAYEQVAPMLARSANEALVEPPRGEGIWFEFASESAPPSFLIKQAKTEFAWGETVLDVDWTNITHQHEQLGQPTTFTARADNSNLWKTLNLNGEMALTEGGIDAKQQWQLKGIQLANLALSERSELMASIASALLDSEGSIALRDNLFDGGGVVRLADMQVLAEADNRWSQVVAETLKSLNRLDIRAALAGSLMSPDVKLDSDLDRQLGSALKASALEAGKAELATFKDSLQGQAGGFLGEQQGGLDELLGLVNSADSRDEKLKEMLGFNLENKLEDKVKDKLKGLFGN